MKLKIQNEGFSLNSMAARLRLIGEDRCCTTKQIIIKPVQMKKLTILLLLISVIISCQPKKENESPEAEVALEPLIEPSINTDHQSATIKKVFDAHGGFDKWTSMKALTYIKGDEKTVTNLQNRKILLETATQKIGFDGDQVWIAPDTLDAGRARFYHNLYFYFYAMPFVVGDPGIFYEDLEPKELLGKTYKGVKISYDDGIGDSPKDNYIVWYDPNTYLMEWLMYTVTFGKAETNEVYKLIKYDSWETFNGLILPTAIAWYSYEDNLVGDITKTVSFQDIQLSEDAPNDAIFELPINGKIAPFPTK